MVSNNFTTETSRHYHNVEAMAEPRAQMTCDSFSICSSTSSVFGQHSSNDGRVQTPGYVPKKTRCFFGYTHLKKPPKKPTLLL